MSPPTVESVNRSVIIAHVCLMISATASMINSLHTCAIARDLREQGERTNNVEAAIYPDNECAP